VFTALLATESNFFPSIPTGAAALAGLGRGAEVFDDEGWFGPSARRVRGLAGEGRR
jgi:hypothetical protein